MAQKIEAARQATAIFGVKPFYADPSYPEAIAAFNEAKISCVPADNSIKAGIDDHYELVKTRRYRVFRGTSPHTLDEYESYHWPEEKLDVGPDKDIKEQTPVKQNEHAMDANRYISRMTRRGMAKHKPGVPDEKKKEDQYARLERLKRKSRGGGDEKWSA